MPSPHVYLLIGKERFLKREFLSDLRNRLFPGGSGADLNTQEFTAGQEPLSAMLDFVLTAPFLGEKRLAVLWEVEELSDEEKKSLLSSLEKFSPTGVLALISEQTNAKKDDFLKELSGKAKLVACHPPFEKDLPAWVETQARKMGISLEKAAAPVLIERAGKEVPMLHSALEELLVFVHPRKVVTAVDVQSLLGKSVQEDVFILVDLLIERKMPQALEALENLLREGTNASEIIAVLAGQCARLAACAERKDEGYALSEIAKELKVHPFFQEKFFAQSKKVSKKSTQKMLRQLLSADEAIKNGRMNERVAVEKFVLERAFKERVVT